MATVSYYSPRSTEQGERKLHRLGAVRRQQQMSLRSVARRMHRDPELLSHEERETTDLTLTQLYRWQEVLEVPVAELLVEGDSSLSPEIEIRAHLVRLMKTATSLSEKADTPATRRLTATLLQQLLEIMPELEGVNPWHSVGQRRSLDEYGQVAHRVYHQPPSMTE
jgi:transcriptional regulator with XRE-family HTH domain